MERASRSVGQGWGMLPLPRTKAWLAALALCCVMQMRSGDAAELAPYQPPSLPNPQMRSLPRPSSANPHNTPSKADPAYTDTFARNAAALKPAQRRALLNDFRTEVDKAIDAGNYEAARHYIELIRVLEDNKRGLK